MNVTGKAWAKRVPGDGRHIGVARASRGVQRPRFKVVLDCIKRGTLKHDPRNRQFQIMSADAQRRSRWFYRCNCGDSELRHQCDLMQSLKIKMWSEREERHRGTPSGQYRKCKSKGSSETQHSWQNWKQQCENHGACERGEDARCRRTATTGGWRGILDERKRDNTSRRRKCDTEARREKEAWRRKHEDQQSPSKGAREAPRDVYKGKIQIRQATGYAPEKAPQPDDAAV